MKDLKELRQEIDRLDDAIHDLLMERATVSARMAGAKGKGPSMRPAREMEVLRRLAARHKGDLPLPAVVRIWREIIAASLAMQTSYSVFLLNDEASPDLRDLARFHFGSAATLVPLKASSHVINEVAEGESNIGVLPMPSFDESAPWWPHLFYADEGAPRIIARLPLLKGASGYGFPDAFALARLEQRPTGDDATLLIMLADQGLRREKAAELVAAQGINVHLLALAPEDEGGRFLLFETDNFVAAKDTRLGVIVGSSERIADLKVVGGFARPIDCRGGTS